MFIDEGQSSNLRVRHMTTLRVKHAHDLLQLIGCKVSLATTEYTWLLSIVRGFCLGLSQVHTLHVFIGLLKVDWFTSTSDFRDAQVDDLSGLLIMMVHRVFHVAIWEWTININFILKLVECLLTVFQEQFILIINTIENVCVELLVVELVFHLVPCGVACNLPVFLQCFCATLS